MLTPKDFSKRSSYLLAYEAQKKGYHVQKMYPKTKKSHLIVCNGTETKTIVGQRIQNTSYNAHFICKDKHLTKRFLQMANISVPKGKTFKKDDHEEILKYFDSLEKPVVIKPLDGVWGLGVSVNITTHDAVKKALHLITTSQESFMDGNVIVEEQIKGKEYRILATREKVLGIIHRIPANVTGDGKQTIKELIEEKNKDPRRGDSHEKALVKITIDDTLLAYLKTQSLTLEDIPAIDQVIYLRKNSNISTGGDSIDYTDRSHPALKKIAPAIIRAIPGLPYGGIDFITKDICEDPEKNGYAVIEINDSPMLSMHHEPFDGTPRNVAKEIIELLF